MTAQQQVMPTKVATDLSTIPLPKSYDNVDDAKIAATSFAEGLHTSIWQETPFGRAVHWATGGRLFNYPDQEPNTLSKVPPWHLAGYKSSLKALEKQEDSNSRAQAPRSSSDTTVCPPVAVEGPPTPGSADSGPDLVDWFGREDLRQPSELVPTAQVLGYARHITLDDRSVHGCFDLLLS